MKCHQAGCSTEKEVDYSSSNDVELRTRVTHNEVESRIHVEDGVATVSAEQKYRPHSQFETVCVTSDHIR